MILRKKIYAVREANKKRTIHEMKKKKQNSS